MIQPILIYGSELWVFKRYEWIERVHFKYCKRFLGVKASTPNVAVLGELGRVPIFTTTYLNCIKWWLKLLSMNNNMIAKHTYSLLVRQYERGKMNWASSKTHVIT